MLTIIGSLIGFLTSFLPKVLGLIQQSKTNDHELKLRRLDADIRLRLQEGQYSYYQQNSEFEEQQLLVRHDQEISKDSGFVGGMRKMVRPLVTYCFFMFFMFFKIVLVIEAIKSGVNLVDISGIVWDEQSQTIFAAVISFWFGSRAIEKLN